MPTAAIAERTAYSALMLTARITLPHFSVSSAISLPNSEGDHRQRHATKVGKARLGLGIGKAGIDLFVELLDNLCRAYSWVHRRPYQLLAS